MREKLIVITSDWPTETTREQNEAPAWDVMCSDCTGNTTTTTTQSWGKTTTQFGGRHEEQRVLKKKWYSGDTTPFSWAPN